MPRPPESPKDAAARSTCLLNTRYSRHICKSTLDTQPPGRPCQQIFFHEPEALCPTIQQLTAFTVSSAHPYFQEGMGSGRGKNRTLSQLEQTHLGLQLQTSRSSPGSTHRQKRQRTPVLLPGKPHGRSEPSGQAVHAVKKSQDMPG